jgi:nitroreductase
MLHAYLGFHYKNNYSLPIDFINEIQTFLKGVEYKNTGGLKILNKGDWSEYSLDGFKKFLACRHSVRDFNRIPIDDEVIKGVIAASLNTPSVCNRQGWLVHYYSEKECIKKLLAFQNGNAGFAECIDKLLIVSGNSKAFTLYEHNQLFIDGGLFSMNILLAIHAAGLGACPLNTCMPFNKESELKISAKIPKHEKLIMMIAVGNLKETFAVAKSEKYSIEDVLKEH